MLQMYAAKRGPLSTVRRIEAGLALVSACTYNAQGAKKQNGRPFEPSDFLPREETEMPDTVENLAAMMVVR